MNRRTFLAGCSTLLGLAAPALADDLTKPDIARLIEQLGSNRFKEREETVRLEILQTFITLLRQTNTYGGAEYEIDATLESLHKKRKGSRPGTPIETDQRYIR